MMPGFLLHEGAVVLCMHGGTAEPLAPNPRVSVSGEPIVTLPGPYAIAGCSLLTNPVTAPTACVTATFVMGATRVRCSGMPVLLRDSEAICVASGTGLQVTMTQPRVKGE